MSGTNNNRQGLPELAEVVRLEADYMARGLIHSFLGLAYRQIALRRSNGSITERFATSSTKQLLASSVSDMNFL